MKILVVEDSETKANAVVRILKAELDEGASIDCAKSFISASRFLESQSYDLLILDIVLPIRDEESAVIDGGRKVLAEIFEGTCLKPSHIICLTAFEEAAPEVKFVQERGLGHLVMYDERGANWSGTLVAKAKYVQGRLREAKALPVTFNVDVAIVTSSPAVELQQVAALPEKLVAEYNQTDAVHYYSGTWTRKSGSKIAVVACAAPTMGMTAASITACKAVERWRPRFLVMTGIAAGTGKDQYFGDVLAAEIAYDYGSGKITEDGRGKREFIPSPRQLTVDSGLSAILQKWEREQYHMEEIRAGWHTPQPRMPKLIVGVIATGAAVVQSRKFVTDILQNSRKVVGLEMEAYGIFHAATLCREPRPRVFVAKAISDFADRKKKDFWQAYAAYTSARFAYEFFTNSDELFVAAEK